MKLLLAIVACAAIAQALEGRIPGTRPYTFSTICEPHDGGGGSGSSHEYVVSTFAAKWSVAEATCVAQGGHLASIHDDDTQAAITAAAGGESVWIGMHDSGTEGIFEWSDGTCVRYEYWAPGEPNEMGSEDCVEISVGLSGWNDLTCESELKFVCQVPIDHGTTGSHSGSGSGSGSGSVSTTHHGYSSGSTSGGYTSGGSGSGSGSTGGSDHYGTCGHALYDVDSLAISESDGSYTLDPDNAFTFDFTGSWQSLTWRTVSGVWLKHDGGGGVATLSFAKPVSDFTLFCNAMSYSSGSHDEHVSNFRADGAELFGSFNGDIDGYDKTSYEHGVVTTHGGDGAFVMGYPGTHTTVSFELDIISGSPNGIVCDFSYCNGGSDSGSGSGSTTGSHSEHLDDTNLLVNADMSDCPSLPHNTPPPGWGGSSTSIGVDCAYWHTGIDPGYPSSGGAPRTQYDHVEGITQTVATSPGALYYVSFWVAGNGGLAEIRYNDKDGSVIAVDTVTNVYTQVSGTFTADSYSTALFIGTDLQSSTGATGDARITRACVSLAPCPTYMLSIVEAPVAFVSEAASETLVDAAAPTYAPSVEKMETKAATSDATIAYLAVGVPVAGLALVAAVVIKTRRTTYAPVSSIEL